MATPIKEISPKTQLDSADSQLAIAKSTETTEEARVSYAKQAYSQYATVVAAVTDKNEIIKIHNKMVIALHLAGELAQAQLYAFAALRLACGQDNCDLLRECAKNFREIQTTLNKTSEVVEFINKATEEKLRMALDFIKSSTPGLTDLWQGFFKDFKQIISINQLFRSLKLSEKTEEEVLKFSTKTKNNKGWLFTKIRVVFYSLAPVVASVILIVGTVLAFMINPVLGVTGLILALGCAFGFLFSIKCFYLALKKDWKNASVMQALPQRQEKLQTIIKDAIVCHKRRDYRGFFSELAKYSKDNFMVEDDNKLVNQEINLVKLNEDASIDKLDLVALTQELLLNGMRLDGIIYILSLIQEALFPIHDTTSKLKRYNYNTEDLLKSIELVLAELNRLPSKDKKIASRVSRFINVLKLNSLAEYIYYQYINNNLADAKRVISHRDTSSLLDSIKDPSEGDTEHVKAIKQFIFAIGIYQEYLGSPLNFTTESAVASAAPTSPVRFTTVNVNPEPKHEVAAIGLTRSSPSA